MRGRFKLDAAHGPVTGSARLSVSYSAADLPGSESADGTLTTTQPSPSHQGDWTVQIPTEGAQLKLEITAPTP
jgi:hypothetical protein